MICLLYSLYYVAAGLTALVLLGLIDNSLMRVYHNAPTSKDGRVYMSFLLLAWPLVFVLYILLIPVVLVSAMVYALKNTKEWL